MVWISRVKVSLVLGDLSGLAACRLMCETADVPNAMEPSSAAQLTTFTEAHLEDVSTPLCSSFDDSSGGVADRGGSAKFPESLGVWAIQTESVPTEISTTIPLDVQHNIGDVDIAAQDYPLDVSTGLALWKSVRGGGLISAPATDNPTSPPRTLETDGSNLPLHVPELLPGGLDIDTAPSDTSPFEEGGRVQRPQLMDDRKRNSASPTGELSSSVGQEDTPRAACGISANTPPSDRSSCDREHSTRSADTINDADTEGGDSDGPPLRRRRRRMQPHIRGSNSASSPLPARSSSLSIEVESITALLRRKRVRRRRRMRSGSAPSDTDDTPTNMFMSRSSRGGGERWPVPCFVERKMVGSQEVITIEVQAFDLRASSGRDFVLSPSDDTSQTTPRKGAASGSQRRARFSRAEEDLLVELKERRDPKISWKEIQRHFPNRTTGSLQVHYSTRLKGRCPRKRAAASKM